MLQCYVQAKMNRKKHTTRQSAEHNIEKHTALTTLYIANMLLMTGTVPGYFRGSEKE